MYKVVSKDLMSARCNPIQYTIGQWTYPQIPNSRLFVFESLDDAKSFRGYGERIFMCETRNVKPQNSIIESGKEFKEFWTNKPLICSRKGFAPQGSYSSEAVKLLYEMF